MIISKKATTDFYLCGEVPSVGWLLDHGRTDQLHPFIIGGVRVFIVAKIQANGKVREKESFEDGLQVLLFPLTINKYKAARHLIA